jgi:type I restriction enzyme, R subunit
LKPDLFGPGRHKEHFLVFDFCQNFEFFNQNPEVVEGATADSLSKRLFAERVRVIVEIDKRFKPIEPPEETGEYTQQPGPVLHASEPGSDIDVEAQHRELRAALTERPREEISGMSFVNFVVRPKRRYVEKYAAAAVWTKIGAAESDELVEHVAGLPSALEDDDVAAKEFDLLILRTQLALMRAETAFAGLREKIVRFAGLLEEITNMPMIAKEMELILAVQTDDFWQDITSPSLETVRRRLRELIELIEVKRRPIVYTDFEDEIGASAEVELRGVNVGTDMDRFRAKARHFLKEHADRIAILKLRRNEPLTPTDLAELERIFVDAGAQPEQLDAIRAEGGLGLFVRSLVGLDREAAKKAFAEFLAQRKPTGDQIEFVNMIVDHLADRA